MIETPFTQVPNHFLDRLHELNASEINLMFCIYRNTLGYHRQQVSMTLTEVMRRTGLSRQSVLYARSKAIEHGLLTYTLKDGVIFWEPVIQASCADGLNNGAQAVQNIDHDGLKNGPEAVQNVDHAGQVVQNVDRDGLKNRPEAVQNVDHADEAVQNLDRDSLKNRPEAVQNLDPLLNKDLNKDLKKEREGKTARPVFEDDFNFERLMPRDYRKVPELALYQKVTKLTPGTLQLNEIVRAIRTHQLTETHLTECWRNWAILNGYRVGNLAWLVEWAPRFKAGERPWERKPNGSGASGRVMGRDAPALKNTVRAEDILADLEAK